MDQIIIRDPEAFRPWSRTDLNRTPGAWVNLEARRYIGVFVVGDTDDDGRIYVESEDSAGWVHETDLLILK